MVTCPVLRCSGSAYAISLVLRMNEPTDGGDRRRHRTRNTPAQHPVERIVVGEWCPKNSAEDLAERQRRSCRVVDRISSKQHRVETVEPGADRKPCCLHALYRKLLVAAKLAECRTIAAPGLGRRVRAHDLTVRGVGHADNDLVGGKRRAHCACG